MRSGRGRVEMGLTKGTFPRKTNMILQLAPAFTPAKISAVVLPSASRATICRMTKDFMLHIVGKFRGTWPSNGDIHRGS